MISVQEGAQPQMTAKQNLQIFRNIRLLSLSSGPNGKSMGGKAAPCLAAGWPDLTFGWIQERNSG